MFPPKTKQKVNKKRWKKSNHMSLYITNKDILMDVKHLKRCSDCYQWNSGKGHSEIS